MSRDEEEKEEISSSPDDSPAPVRPPSQQSPPQQQQQHKQQSSNQQQKTENDSKNSMYAVLLTILIILVAAGIAVILVFALRNDDDGNGGNPTPPSPTASPVTEPTTLVPSSTSSPVITGPPDGNEDGELTEEEREVLLDVFATAVGDDVYVEGTTEALAAEWIFFQDPRRAIFSPPTSISITRQQNSADTKELQPEEQNIFLQRYLLVFFYYSTTIDRTEEWRSCGAPPYFDESSDMTCTFQKLVPPAYDDANQENLVYTEIPWIQWLTAAHECDWAGVTCVTTENGMREVTDIDLAGQGLRGTLVSELLRLPSLKSLIFSYNDFTGALVEEYGRLETLELAYNQLVGRLPEFMFRPGITFLQRLNVGANFLSGELPLSLSFATNLKTLMIFDNNLSGEIPQVMGQLELESFQAQGNELVGPLPLDSNNVVWASSLEQFWVQNNQLSGSLPTQIGLFVRLEELRLSSNNIRGGIPEAIYGVSSLVRLQLDQNAFTGTISPRLNLLTSLEIFDVSSNSLIGPMADVTGLRNLEVVRIQFNLLSGQVPTSTCNLLDTFALEVLEADCLPAFNPPIACECCTLCCNVQTKTCGGSGTDPDEAELTAVREFVLQTFGDSVDLTPGSAHDLAVHWIALDDPAQLAIPSSTFLQRYVLAAFYYHTAPWRSCNPADDPNIVSCIFERFVRNNDDSIGFVQEPATRWLSGASECDWVGIQCSFGSVFRIELFGQELSGTIPTELMLLPGVADILLAYNQFSGTIPPSYGGLPSLRDFEVHGNRLTGTIPSTFFEASNDLLVFNVGENFLSGTIPAQIGMAGNTLRGFHVFSNILSGTIPISFSSLTDLRFARLSGNRFEGTIFSEIANFYLLRELWLHTNNFSGSFPSALGFLTSLGDLRLQSNVLTGPIPSEIGFLHRLGILRLDSNSFTGTIVTEVGALTSLVQLRLSTNQLSGTIPSELGRMVNLSLLWLHRNNLEGELPPEVCTLPFLRFVQTDCLEVQCFCCTACCFDGDACTET